MRAEVLRIDALPPEENVAWVTAWPEGQRVRVRVLGVWKGELQETADVFTGFGHGDCGYPFQPGREYLIFARRLASGRLITAVCTRTRLASEATDDLSALGPARPPAASASESTQRPHN